MNIIYFNIILTRVYFILKIYPFAFAVPKERITNSSFPFSRNSKYSWIVGGFELSLFFPFSRHDPCSVSRLITRYITANVCRELFSKIDEKESKNIYIYIINPFVLSSLSISSFRHKTRRNDVISSFEPFLLEERGSLFDKSSRRCRS